MRRCRRLLSSCLLAATIALPLAARAETAGPADSKSRVAIISAFSPELTILLGKTQVERKVSINGIEFTLGKLAGKDVVLFLSGESMVNAASNTQLLLDRFNVKAIVFSGIAGGVNPALHIGDVVVAKRWGQYLRRPMFARQVGNRYRLPSRRQAGVQQLRVHLPAARVTVETADHPEGETRFWFHVDPGMLAAAREDSATRSRGSCSAARPTTDASTKHPAFEVGGNGVSGMAFVDNKAFREYAYCRVQGQCPRRWRVLPSRQSRR